jgi:glycosyltransferase involved in cell wall biosynthesis
LAEAHVDEIVILDTGSTDKTVEIARGLGADVHEGYVWKDDFADARNTCLRLCTGDWILCIDADDRIDAGMFENIHKAIAHAEETSENIEAIQALMHCGNDQFYSDRIIKNKPEVHFLRPVHEYVNCKEKYRPEVENEITITFQNREPRGGDIWWIMKIIETQLRKEPDDLRWQYVAGREYFVRGYLPYAIYWFDRYFRYREQNNFWFGTSEVADAYFTLAGAYMAMAEYKPAKECALKCLGFNADFQEA